jgi:hypothetical protein
MTTAQQIQDLRDAAAAAGDRQAFIDQLQRDVTDHLLTNPPPWLTGLRASVDMVGARAVAEAEGKGIPADVAQARVAQFNDAFVRRVVEQETAKAVHQLLTEHAPGETL